MRTSYKGYNNRTDGRIEHKFTLGGKRYSVYGRTIQECQAKEKQKILSILTGDLKNEPLDSAYKEIHLSELYDMWKLKRRGSIQESTRYTNDRRWNNIFSILGDKLVYEVTEKDLIKARLKMIESGRYTTSTINDVVGQFDSIMKYALASGMIYKNPCENIKNLKRKEPEATDTNHRALTASEETLFLKYAKESWYYNYFLFMLRTGVRCGEASALMWSDVDFDNSIIHINKTWSRIGHNEWVLRDGLKTKAGKRDIPMNEGIKGILFNQLDFQSGSIYNDKLNLVFRNTMGNWIQRNTTNLSIKHILWRIAEEEEVIIPAFSNHAFRATFATRAIENGMQPDVLKNILGHSKIATTMDLYCHVLPDRKRREMEMIDKKDSLI